MIPLVRLWIWISVFASLAGWTLSALGQLNRAGYAVSFLIFAAFIFLRRNDLGFGADGNGFRIKRFLRRLRRPLPFCFAALAALVFLGGVLYASGNYTGMTYRVPRILQWLAHEQWHWIHTPVYRMNDRACGIEWLSTPLLLFTQSLRGLFVVNFLPFLLLPGLIYSVFTRLGVRARVAWHWMWLLPAGYGFILQAGGTANDTFPAVYALAALDFALRARQPRWTGSTAAAVPSVSSDVWHSILAAALLTGAKASNLPLLLPWAILIYPFVPLLWKKTVGTGLVLLAAALVSFLPNALLNVRYCGDWTGGKLEPAIMTVSNPVIAVTGNVFQLLLDNFAPPVFPLAGWWNAHAPLVLPRALVAVSKHFDDGLFWLGELPTEDWAGLGFGLSGLLLVSMAAAVWGRARRSSTAGRRLAVPAGLANQNFRRIVLLAPWLALLVYCAKSGMTNGARLIAPYYLLLMPLLLAGETHSQLIRRRWWQILAGGTLVLAFLVLVLSPDRPLWPAKTVLSRLAVHYPDQRLFARALKVYSVYANRSDSLASVRALLPPEATRVGFIGTADDSDISFWQPFGHRRVEHFLLSDPPELIRQAKIEYLVIGGENLQRQRLTLEDWLQQSGAEQYAVTNATLKVSGGLQPWYIVRLKP